MIQSVRRWMLGAAGAVLVVTSWACGNGEAAEGAGTPTRLTTTVRRGDLVIRAEATGVVEPVRKVEVKSKASGEILRLHADVGDQVQAGALLAEIDPRDVRNNYNQVQANLEVARARAQIAEAQLDRSNQLLAASVITQQEHENARLDNTNAQAELVRAQTNFELAQLQMNDVSIRAPMNGTIIQKNVEEGAVIQSASQNVSGGTALFLMADLAEMQVRTLVDETDVGMLQAGLAAEVSVEAFTDRSFEGVISKIEPQAVVEQNVTMFPVIVSLDNSAGLLKPGMNAEVEVFIDEARGVLLVPNNAIVQTQNVGPAAMALGLDIESLDLTAFEGGGGRTFTAGGAGPGAKVAPAAVNVRGPDSEPVATAAAVRVVRTVEHSSAPKPRRAYRSSAHRSRAAQFPRIRSASSCRVCAGRVEVGPAVEAEKIRPARRGRRRSSCSARTEGPSPGSCSWGSVTGTTPRS